MYYFIVLNLKALLFLILTQAIHKTWAVYAVTFFISLTTFLIAYKYLRKHKHGIIFGIYAGISILMFADTLYCLYFNQLLSVKTQSQITQLPGVINVISSLFSFWVLLFLIDLPILLLYFRKKKTFEMRPLNVNYFKLSLVTNIVLIFFILTNHFQTIRAYEFFTHHTVDLVESISQPEADDSIINDNDLKQLIDKSKLIQGPLTGIAKGRNVIMIQVEALQTMALFRKIKGHEITPNLNRLIENQGTLFFDDIYQSAARGNTSDAEFAVLNSLLPSSSEIVYETSADKNYYSLAHRLKDAGYDTSYFHANDGEFYNRRTMTQALGFNHFFDASKFPYEDEKEVISYGINDFAFYNYSLNYLKELDKQSTSPWMSFLISLSSHTPFNLKEENKTLNLTTDESNIALNYFESMHYMDTALGEFIDGLKKEGLYDNSMIVIYGDHFGLNSESDDHRKATESVINRDYTLEDMMNIPLIVHIPDTDVKQTISSVGSQIDIYPTLLNLMDLQNDKGIMLGQDLINSKRYNAVNLQFFVDEHSFIDAQFVYKSARDKEIDHSILIDRKTKEVLDSSLVNNQIELNQKQFELNKQILLQDRIRY